MIGKKIHDTARRCLAEGRLTIRQAGRTNGVVAHVRGDSGLTHRAQRSPDLGWLCNCVTRTDQCAHPHRAATHHRHQRTRGRAVSLHRLECGIQITARRRRRDARCPWYRQQLGDRRNRRNNTDAAAPPPEHGASDVHQPPHATAAPTRTAHTAPMQHRGGGL